MSSTTSAIINGGRGSNSHDFKLQEMSRRRRSVSRIGRNPSKIESVDAKNGGGESAVDARRFPILVVTIARKSLAVKDGASGGREERPMRPEMDVHSRFGFLSLRLIKFSQEAASFRR